MPHGKPTLSLSFHGVGQFPLPTPRSCNRLSQSNHNLVWFCRLTRTKREPSAIFRFFAAQAARRRRAQRRTLYYIASAVPTRARPPENRTSRCYCYEKKFAGSARKLARNDFRQLASRCCHWRFPFVKICEGRPVTKFVTCFGFLKNSRHLEVTKIVTD